MLSLRDVHTAELRWNRPSRKMWEYELLAGDSPVLRVRWERKWRARATVASAAGTWTIDKRGTLRPSVVITDAGGTVDIANFRGNWRGGGTLEFGDGRTYTWSNTNLLHTAWVWTDRLGLPLLRFKGKSMTLEPAGHVLSDILLLAGLSWYLNIMNNKASDGSGAVIAAMPV